MGRSLWAARIGVAALSTSALFAASPGFAQNIPVGPTRDELTRNQPPPETKAPSLNVVGDIERSPCPLADPKFADIRLTINDVVFNNLKGATPEEMRAAWTPYAGSERPVAVICEIRDAAATMLRDKGYLAAVQVPTQKIENGIVRLEVLYARVTTVRARGQVGGAEAKIAGYLSKLTEDEIFDRFRAERYLLLARDLPGYNVQLTLKPAGTGPGELIGEVSVLHRPYAVDVTVQNLAARQTGRWGGQVRAQAFGLTGLGDVTYVSLYSTADLKEQQILEFGHSFRPGSEGLTIDGQFTYAWTKPDIDAAPGVPDLKARTVFATLGASYPFKRSQGFNLWLGGGFDFVHQKVDFFGPLTDDKLRILWLRGTIDGVDLSSRRPKWRYGAQLELRKGLDIFDASESCTSGGCGIGSVPPSRFDGKATATVIRGSASGELALGQSFAIALSPRAQYAFAPLLSFEEYTAGNYTVGRGYEPATLAGDSGVGFAAELRGPHLSLIKQSQLLVQPYVFSDAAWVWNKNLSGDPDHLLSVGGGARAELGDRLHLDATVAVPAAKAGPLNRRGDTRFLLTLTSRLLPWRS
ncbi:MAG TPA: ShlB/FhaC/HecB family hemolysin secretion/activation protein [Sphingomicrobium sp.]|nr:ShlB/FhaC/HecB family hemolysin secretion/activation protein [Sphingomicrobium sp.]